MTFKKISAFAPGKLILSGEHSVVYGHYAIAMAVNRGVWVTLEEVEGKSYCENGDSLINKAISSFLPPIGIKMSFQTDLPLGRGMGSSAALSISLVRALAKWNNRQSDLKEEFEQGLKLETFFHGNPSGLDHTVSSLGKTLLYRKTSSIPKITPMTSFSLSLVIIDSGSTGNTAEMVQKVSTNYSQNKHFIEQMGTITLQIKDLLMQDVLNEEQLGELFIENQMLLKKIGVSTQNIDVIIKQAMKLGALGAKLSGSGGGGIVMILAKNPQQILEKMKQLGYKGFIIRPYLS